MILISLIYWTGFFIAIISCDVNVIGSSISVAVPSGSEIKNSKSFSDERTKRASDLFARFGEEDESSEEHHKSKRCWRARPVQKVKLSTLEQEDTENVNNRVSLPSQDSEYNLNKLFNDQKRSIEKSEEEEYWENNRESSEVDNSNRKLPFLKIVPVKNPRTNLKEFFATGRQIEDEISSNESEENTEDVILKRIKNHLNSDDYNVLALVGKRTSHPSSNKQKKYVCYCREANCSRGNCQRMMYRPCSTCRNSRPVFIGKANSNYCTNGVGDRNIYHKNQESQLTNARMPLKIKYPGTKNEVIENPENSNVVQLKKNPAIPSLSNGVNQLENKNMEQNLNNLVENRRPQFLYDTPKIVLANPNVNINPWDQYRILHIPISNSKIPEFVYPPVSEKPAANEYRSENVKFAPNHNPYNQWAVNSYYSPIGNSKNFEMQNNNQQVNPQNFIKPYPSNNRFIGSQIPFDNKRTFAFSHPRITESQNIGTFGTTESKMMKNMDSISNDASYSENQNVNAFGRNTKTPIKTFNYQKNPESSLTQSSAKFYSEKNHRIENTEGNDSRFNIEDGSYAASAKDSFDPAMSSDTNNYNQSDESQENNSNDSINEDSSEEKINDGEESISEDPLAYTESYRDEPQQYKIPIMSLEKGNPSEANKFLDTPRGYEISDLTRNSTPEETREEYDDKNSNTKSLDHDDVEDHSNDETNLRNQLERPENAESNSDEYSMVNHQMKKPGSEKHGPLLAAGQKYSDLKESEEISDSEETNYRESTIDGYSDIRVVTNGYSTSEVYNDYNGEIEDEDYQGLRVVGTHRSNSNNEESYKQSNQNRMENEKVEMRADDKTFDSSNIHQSGHEDFDEASINPENQSLENETTEIMPSTDSSSSEEISSNESEFVAETIHSVESDKLKNIASNCMRADNEIIESPMKTEKSSIEVIGKGESDAAEYEAVTSRGNYNYESDSSMEEGTLNRNENDARKAADGNNFEGYFRSKSIESYEDVSYDNSTEYSTQGSPVVFDGNSSKSPADELVGKENVDDSQKHGTENHYDRLDEEPAIIEIEKSPPRYFSPKDRVLEYIKKHSQNLVGHVDPDKNDQRISQTTPIYETEAGGGMQRVTTTIYHRKFNQDESADPDSQGFNSGSESDEIITRTSKFNSYEDSYENENENSEEQTVFHDATSHEFPSKEDETIVQNPRYEEREHMQLSDCGRYDTRTESIVFEGLEHENHLGKPKELQKPFDEINSIEPGEISTKTFKQDLPNEGNQIHGEVDDHSEGFLDTEENESSEKSGLSLKDEDKSANDGVVVNPDLEKVIVNNPIHSEIERPPEIIGSYRNEPEKSTHEEDHGAESHRETIRKHSKTDTSTPVESTEESIPLDNSEEMNVGLRNEYAEITHKQNQFSPHDTYDYADSTEGLQSVEESMESGTSYRTENSSANKYTQNNERGDAAWFGKKTSSCRHRIVDQKSVTESYDDNKKLLMGRFLDHSASEENSKTNGQQEEIPNSKPDDLVSQNEFVIQQTAAASEEDDYSNSSDDDHTMELQKISTERIAEDVSEDSMYYTTQSPQITHGFYDTRRNEPHEESPSEIKSEKNLDRGDEPKKDSGEMKNVEFVSSSQSRGCCTKPPEVQDDSGYLGRLEPRKSNSSVKSIGDLVDSDLYYIGDGVKLPLTIKKLKDGSFALSISDKICEERLKEKCPCCVPRKGEILQEKHSEENSKESTEKTESSSLHRRAIPDDEKSEIDDEELDDSKTLDIEQHGKQNKRVTRSISMPVDEFAEKYNLLLNLNDITAVESPLSSNAIHREEAKDEMKNNDNYLLQQLQVSINEVPENERADVLLSTLNELIRTEPTEVFGVVNATKKKLRGIKSAEDDQEEDNYGEQKIYRYGYQIDNPILDRIKIIKELQKEAKKKCEHKYQKHCDDAISQKTELLTMILHWLKELVMSKPN